MRRSQQTDAIYSIPCKDWDNEYIGQTKRQFGTRLKEIKNQFSFAKRKIQHYRSTHAQLTIQLGGIILKLSPLIGVTTSAFVWRLGILTPPTLLYIVTMAACLLAPIDTLSEKRQLFRDHIKKTSCCSVYITTNEGTRQECLNVGSMNCNLFGYIH